LLEVVEDAKNIEICVCNDDKKIEMVDDEIIQQICA
jgi:hypothetical protein